MISLPLEEAILQATGGPVKPIPTAIPTPPEYQVSSDGADKALWVVFALMLLFSAVFAGLSWSVPVPRRLYHSVATLTAVVATLSYYALASGQGVALSCVSVADHHEEVPDTYHPVCREVAWARYVDWAITTPLLVSQLCLLAGVSGAHTLMAMTADLVMVLTGFFATFGSRHGGVGGKHGEHKWGWYAMACIAYLVVIWHVALHGTRSVRANKTAKVARHWGSLAVFALILWTAYPILWAVAPLARKASVDAEIYAYAVLDFLAKPVFGLWLLLGYRYLPETSVVIDGFWSHGVASEGQIRIGDNDDV